MIQWNKRIIIALLCLLLCYSFSLSCAAAKELTRYDPITKSCRILGFDSFWGGKGRRLFDQKCRACHSKSNSANAPFLHAESKSPKGWTRVFFTKYPKCAQTGAWKVTVNETLLMNDYLYRNGADTYNPNIAS